MARILSIPAAAAATSSPASRVDPAPPATPPVEATLALGDLLQELALTRPSALKVVEMTARTLLAAARAAKRHKPPAA